MHDSFELAEIKLARQGQQFCITFRSPNGSNAFRDSVYTYDGATYKEIHITDAIWVYLHSESPFIPRFILPPLTGTMHTYRNSHPNILDEQLLKDPEQLELLPDTDEGLPVLQLTETKDLKVYRLDGQPFICGKQTDTTQFTIDPVCGNAILAMRTFSQNQLNDGATCPRIPHEELKVSGLVESNGIYYPTGYDLARFSPAQSASDAAEMIECILDPNNHIFSIFKATETIHSYSQRFRASEVRLNEELGPDDLDYAIQDGARIHDFRRNPPLTYRYKKDMSAAEWQAVMDRYNEMNHREQDRRRIRESLVGQPAPALKVAQWVGSDPLELSGLRGRKVLLVFFGFGCGPCVYEINYLKDIRAVTPESELAIIGLHTPEEPKEIAQKIEAFEINFPIGIAADEGASFNKYGVHGIPEAFLIDAEGRVIKFGNPRDLLRSEELELKIARYHAQG